VSSRSYALKWKGLPGRERDYRRRDYGRCSLAQLFLPGMRSGWRSTCGPSIGILGFNFEPDPVGVAPAVLAQRAVC
jgi:hypothetical protein